MVSATRDAVRQYIAQPQPFHGVNPVLCTTNIWTIGQMAMAANNIRTIIFRVLMAIFSKRVRKLEQDPAVLRPDMCKRQLLKGEIVHTSFFQNRESPDL